MERVIVVAVINEKEDEALQHRSVEELKSLVTTAHGTVVHTSLQNRRTADVSRYVGSGKVDELSEFASELEVDVIVINDELSPRQGQSLSESTGVAVIDRTQLILDIFAERARTREGKIQVELAQLTYLLPRLRGQGLSLSRLGGGIGTRGPGETKLETDRRHIHRRMDELKRDLVRVQKHRDVRKHQKQQGERLHITLVGYTNAGKTTLLNALTDEQAFAEDLLFATLDPLTRRLRLPSGLEVQVSDTVGFIRDLPTTLIASFRSTLEEVTEADLLVHVVDASSEHADDEVKTVESLLQDLGASGIETITVLNKQDEHHSNRETLVSGNAPRIEVSAKTGRNIEELLLLLEKQIISFMEPYEQVVPAGDGKRLSRLKSTTIVQEEDFDEQTESYFVKGYARSQNRYVNKDN
ncbi:GTPase HflX [Geomicrobium sp. JSM 1781026]|uniref:GTPase HflX n=1 Tax=Geomicrobium sp. JSM 1781026 TaxID=3344580 RepID=UPI0035C19E9A